MKLFQFSVVLYIILYLCCLKLNYFILKTLNLFLIFIFSLFAFNSATAQDWKWLNPLPANDSWQTVYFPTAEIGYAGGTEGNIIKSNAKH